MVTDLINFLEELKKEHSKKRPYYTFSDDCAKLNKIIKGIKNNETRRKMWEELRRQVSINGFQLEDQNGFEIMTKIIKQIEQEYLESQK